MLDFTSENIIKLYPIIRVYVQKRLETPEFYYINPNAFTDIINDYLSEQKDLQQSILNKVFSTFTYKFKRYCSKNPNGVFSYRKCW